VSPFMRVDILYYLINCVNELLKKIFYFFIKNLRNIS
jgi:hypothetical protein